MIRTKIQSFFFVLKPIISSFIRIFFMIRLIFTALYTFSSTLNLQLIYTSKNRQFFNMRDRRISERRSQAELKNRREHYVRFAGLIFKVE